MTEQRRPFERTIINADDQQVTLALVHSDLKQLDYYVADGRPVRCPDCDRPSSDELELSKQAMLHTCSHCKKKFLVVTQADAVYDQELEMPAGEPKPAPNMYSRQADLTRRHLWHSRAVPVLEQAKAFATYGDHHSAAETLRDFYGDFVHRFGEIPELGVTR